MRTTTRRITTGLAAAALAIGAVAGTGQAAQAADWDGVSVISAADAKAAAEIQSTTTDAVCTVLKGAAATVCGAVGFLNTQTYVQRAADQGCGLTVRWRATGSQMSYDKAVHEYSLNC